MNKIKTRLALADGFLLHFFFLLAALHNSIYCFIVECFTFLFQFHILVLEQRSIALKYHADILVPCHISQ